MRSCLWRFFSWLVMLLSLSPATPVRAETSQRSLQQLGISFAVPAGWSIEDVRDMDVVLMLAPTQEADWQANISLELRVDNETRPLATALATLSKNMAAQKRQYKEIRRSVEKTTKGVQYGILEYSSQNQGTALIDWEIVVPLKKQDRLMIDTSTAAAVSDKYLGTFRAFVESLEIPK